jgi:hypothetical protein
MNSPNAISTSNVAAAPAVVVNCPHCRQELALDPRLAGQVVTCGYCRRPLTMPAPPVAAHQVPQCPAPQPTEVKWAPFRGLLVSIIVCPVLLFFGLVGVGVFLPVGIAILVAALATPIIGLKTHVTNCPHCLVRFHFWRAPYQCANCRRGIYRRGSQLFPL